MSLIDFPSRPSRACHQSLGGFLTCDVPDLSDHFDEVAAAPPVLPAVEDRLETLWRVSNRLVLTGLAGHPQAAAAIQAARLQLSGERSPRPSGLANWQAHVALWLNRHGCPGQAMELLDWALPPGGGRLAANGSVRAHCHAQLAEAARLRGRLRESLFHLEQAASICRDPDGRIRLASTLLNHVLTGRARTLADHGHRGEAYQLLRREVFPLQMHRALPGSLRTRVLLARLLPAVDVRRNGCEILHASVSREAAHHPGFAACPVLAKVLAHWDAWCAGEHDPHPPPGAETGDTFWGV